MAQPLRVEFEATIRPKRDRSSFSIDHMFLGHDADDGDNPRHDAMTPLNGLLYGTTLEGGTHNNGIIVSIGQDGTGYQVLLSLHNSIGDESHSCFVVANNRAPRLKHVPLTTNRHELTQIRPLARQEPEVRKISIYGCSPVAP